MSSIVRPAWASTRSVAETGPIPIRCGSTPVYAKATRRIDGSSPSSAATDSAASSPAVAPSVSPAELPAVTRPPTRNGVRSAARPSSVVSGRRNSSRSATRQPSSPNTLIGTTVCAMIPSSSAHAAAARRWLSSA